MSYDFKVLKEIIYDRNKTMAFPTPMHMELITLLLMHAPCILCTFTIPIFVQQMHNILKSLFNSITDRQILYTEFYPNRVISNKVQEQINLHP
jgi:hypothetical protein